jgi:hypothetical protein
MGTYNLQLHHDDDCRDYWENPANKKVRYLFDLIQISRKTSGKIQGRTRRRASLVLTTITNS